MLNGTPNRRGGPSVKTSVLHDTKIKQSTIIYIHKDINYMF